MRVSTLRPKVWLVGFLVATIVPLPPAQAQVRSRTVTVSPRNRTVARDSSTIRGRVRPGVSTASRAGVSRDSTEIAQVSPFAAAAAEVLRLTNVERATAGCPPLVAHDSLAAAAMAHSEDMATHGTLGHTGSDGRTALQRARDAGYVYRRLAENVAAGQRDAPGVIHAWMNSPGHRRNILNCELRDIGIGVAQSPEGPSRMIYWTQLFGTPR